MNLKNLIIWLLLIISFLAWILFQWIMFQKNIENDKIENVNDISLTNNLINDNGENQNLENENIEQPKGEFYSEQTSTWQINENVNVLMITDSSVEELKDVEASLFDKVKAETFLEKANFEILDFSDENHKAKILQISKETWLDKMPIVLFDTNELYDNWIITNFIEKTLDWKFSLQVWANSQIQ